MSYLIIAVLLAVIVWQGISSYRDKQQLIGLVKESTRLLEMGLDRWETERQQLLDRIQAPSFDHLKHHEVRVIKAQNGTKDPPPLEPL